MENPCFFVTGTDTDIGKTYVTVQLLEYFKKYQYRTAAMKPIAAGCEETVDGLRNEDALLLSQAMTENIDYELMNPVTLKPAIAPHIAVAQLKQTLELPTLIHHFEVFKKKHNANIAFCEGAGGWLTPLNDHQNYSDFAIALQLPVILVVGIRLGCLNHALLTADRIQSDGLTLAGWIANQVQPDSLHYQENVETLKHKIQAPFLGQVFHCEKSINTTGVGGDEALLKLLSF